MVEEIETLLESALTVGELIEQLSLMDQEARVLFTCNYGDYHNTQQVLGITGADEYDTSNLMESGYSHSRVALCDDDDEEQVDSDAVHEAIIILS